MGENTNGRDGRARPPLLSVAARHDAPASRVRSDETLGEQHRRAKARRLAAPSPLLSALADKTVGVRYDEAADRSQIRSRDAFLPEDDEAVLARSPANAPATDAFAPAPSPRPRTASLLQRLTGASRDSETGEGAHETLPGRGNPARQASAWPGESPHMAEHSPPITAYTAGDPVSPAPDAFYPLIDLGVVFRSIYRAKWLIATTTLAGIGVGVLIALSTPHTYTAYSQILIDPRDVKVVGKDLTPDFLANEAVLALIDSQSRVITSTNVLRKVIDQTGLDRDPEFNGTDEAGLLAPLKRALGAFGFGSTAGDDANDRLGSTLQSLRERIWVERSNRTFVLNIAVTSQNPEKSAQLANTLTGIFMVEQGEQKSALATKTSDELTARLGELRRTVEEAEQKIEQYKAQNGLIDVQGRLTDDDELVALNSQLGAARNATVTTKVRADSARVATLEGVLNGDLPETLASAQLAELRSQYARARQDVDILERKFGPRHPQNIEAQTRVSALREEIGAELRRIAQSAQAALRDAVRTEQELAGRLAQLKARQADNGSALVELRELQRKADTARAVYENFLLSARETSELKGLSTANMQVISEAEPPQAPSSASRKMTVIGGALAGFMLGFGFAALRGAWQSLAGAPLPGGPRKPAPLRAASDALSRRWLHRGENPVGRSAPASAKAPTATDETVPDNTRKGDAMPPYRYPAPPQADPRQFRQPYAPAAQYAGQPAPPPHPANYSTGGQSNPQQANWPMNDPTPFQGFPVPPAPPSWPPQDNRVQNGWPHPAAPIPHGTAAHQQTQYAPRIPSPQAWPQVAAPQGWPPTPQGWQDAPAPQPHPASSPHWQATPAGYAAEPYNNGAGMGHGAPAPLLPFPARGWQGMPQTAPGWSAHPAGPQYWPQTPPLDPTAGWQEPQGGWDSQAYGGYPVAQRPEPAAYWSEASVRHDPHAPRRSRAAPEVDDLEVVRSRREAARLALREEQEAVDADAIDDLRASLREVRDAVDALAGLRARRRA